MADERRSDRKPGRPARGRSGPSGGRRPAPGSRPTPSGQRREADRERALVAARAEAGRAEERRRTRLTGRAAILVLVLAVLAVSYASSMRAYLQQRNQIEALQSQISQREDAIADLKTEKERWQDDAFIAQQARERFGYVQRGETPYVVVGEDGEPLDGTAELTDPDSVGDTEPRAWYGDMWESMKVAGNPPTRIPGSPSERIDPPKEDLAE